GAGFARRRHARAERAILPQNFLPGHRGEHPFPRRAWRRRAMWMIDYGSTRHVGRHRGTLPVVLACPHGGGETLPVPERTGHGLPPRCHFTTTRDRQTTTVTRGIAQRLLE